MGAVGDEIVGPHVVAMLRSAADTGSIIQPESPALGLPLGDFQALLAPDPLDTLVIDPPALTAQQRCDATVAVATKATAQLTAGMLDGTPPAGWAQKFPLAVSRRMALFRAWSATSFFSRAFSFSSSFRRLA